MDHFTFQFHNASTGNTLLIIFNKNTLTIVMVTNEQLVNVVDGSHERESQISLWPENRKSCNENFMRFNSFANLLFIVQSQIETQHLKPCNWFLELLLIQLLLNLLESLLTQVFLEFWRLYSPVLGK